MSAAQLTVVAVRYCADVAPMSTFFETLGLSRRVASERGGFVDLVAGAGLVMLHAASDAQTGLPAGSASLAFQTDDLDATQRALADRDPVRWDESYGEHLGIRDAHGHGIWIDEVQRDLHGYHAEPAMPNYLNLMAVRESEDFATDAAFFAGLGFLARSGGSDDFAPLDGVAPARGTIGLHPPYSVPTAPVHDPDDPMSPPLQIRLSFETHEPLDALLARLTAAGIAATRDDTGAPHLTIVDPEGLEIEIHQKP